MDGTVKAVAFDIDGTLVSRNFWPELNAMSGVSVDLDRELMEKYHSKEISYEEWMRRISDIFRNQPQEKSAIEEISKSYTYADGAMDVVAYIKAKYPVALISSNVDVFVKRIASDLEIEHAYWYTDFRYSDDERFTDIGYAYEGTEQNAKVDSVADFARKIGVLVNEIAFVGDSRNDLAVFKATGKGILIGEGDDDLRAIAWNRIKTLTELKDIL